MGEIKITGDQNWEEIIRKNLDGGGNGITDETFSCLPSSEADGGDLSTSIQLEKGDRRIHFGGIEKEIEVEEAKCKMKWYEITIPNGYFLFIFLLN